MSQTTYEKTTWEAGSTALSAENFNHLEQGVEDAHEMLANIFNAIYPVGSIYMSAELDTPAKVMEKFGGTWVAWGQGRVPVGVGTADGKTFAANETGGKKDAIIPSHSHSATFAGTAVGNHTHTGPSHTHTGPSHTHTVSGTAASAGEHNHTATISVVAAGTHHHTVKTRTIAASGSGVRSAAWPQDTMYSDSYNVYTSDSGSHTHSASGSIKNAGAHQHSVTGTAAAAGTGATGAAGNGATSAAGGHTPAGTVTVASNGESVTDKNLQPYITCFMYRRVA